MTHADKNKYYQKHPGRTKVDDVLKQKILHKVTDNNLSCALAEEIARSAQVTLKETGVALDLLNINIVACQLGSLAIARRRKLCSRQKMLFPD